MSKRTAATTKTFRGPGPKALERARKLVEDDCMWMMALAEQAAAGSCENAVRWTVLGDTVRWCALTLGQNRARVQAGHPREWHRQWLRHWCTPRRWRRRSVPEGAHGRMVAVRVLSLVCLCTPPDYVARILDEGVRPYGTAPPWLSPRGVGGILFGEAVDRAMAEREARGA